MSRFHGTIRLVLGACALLALALPAAASAHPGVYTVTAKTGPSSCTYENDTPLHEGACLTTTQTQYAVANDGYAMGFKEDNGISGETAEHTGGLLNFKMMPSTYRAGMTAEQKRTYAPAQTGVQPHATCSHVPALASGPNILAWQQRSDNDPFYNYIPWQKTTAGLGDDPAKWIPVVKEATGVDLSALSTEAEFKAACEALNGGTGVYHKADTSSNIVSAQTAAAAKEAVAPFEAQVATLSGEKTTLLGENSNLQAQIDAFKASKGSLEGEKAALTSQVSSLSGELAKAEQASAKKSKTIKRLRAQLRRAKRHA